VNAANGSSTDRQDSARPGAARPKPKLAEWQQPRTERTVVRPARRWPGFGQRRREPSASGRQVYRLPGPIVVSWIWGIFLAANLIDLAVSGRDWDSLVVLWVLALITGGVYAMAYRPRVITDPDGVTVLNPFRDHRVPWGGINKITVGESVQLRCARPDSEREKTVHSWALYASRRSRIRKGPRRRPSLFATPATPVNSKLPPEAQELLKKSACDQVVSDLELKAKLAKDRGAAPGTWSGSWPWVPAAAVLVPAAALALTLLLH
jgi:hypothetical protein